MRLQSLPLDLGSNEGMYLEERKPICKEHSATSQLHAAVGSLVPSPTCHSMYLKTRQVGIWPTGALQSYIEDGTKKEEQGRLGCSSSEGVRGEGVSLIITRPAHPWALNPWEYILTKTYNPISVRVLPPCHYTFSSLDNPRREPKFCSRNFLKT